MTVLQKTIADIDKLINKSFGNFFKEVKKHDK